MKIISKYKDYYDYLSGIWGEDPLITFVRKHEGLPYNSYFSCYKIKVYIGGMLVEGLCYKGNFYYGDTLLPFSSKPPYYLTLGASNFSSMPLEKEYGIDNLKVENLIFIERDTLRDGRIDPWSNLFIQKKPIVDVNNVNEKEGSPVVVEINKERYKDCCLKDLNVSSILSAEEVYKLISDWLSLQRTKAENKPDARTNVQKIESHGFDNKTSFRPNIK